MAAYLANVGANASHPLRSPLRADGSFTLWPIPEPVSWAPPMLRLRDLPAATGAPLPARWLDRAIHLDPDLDGQVPTYGDNCRRAGRAFSLRRAQPGDVIYFLARLHPEGRPASFHVVGALEVEAIVPDLVADPGDGWWSGNAHVRRARATGRWDSFWLFKGTAASGLFARAIPFGREHADELLAVRWRELRTEQQTIASHTRAVRRLTGDAERTARALWKH